MSKKKINDNNESISDIKSNIKTNIKTNRKTNRKTPAIFLFVVIVLLLLIIGFGAYYIFHSKEYLIKGTWIEEIDLTREVENSINGYLSEALFSDEISVNEYLEEIKLEAVLNVDEDNNYTLCITKDSYDKCVNQANEALKKAVTGLIEKRMDMLSVENEEETDKLVEEAIGMKLEDYLSLYGPVLLEDYDTYKSRYERHGKYVFDGDFLRLSDENVTNEENEKNEEKDDAEKYEFVVTKKLLVVEYKNKTVVFHKN